MKKNYGHDFYAARHRKTVHTARTVLSLVLDALPRVRSAIDLGCGVGTWLSVLKEKGVLEVRGLDGPWVDQKLLEISREEFQQVDLEETIAFERRYDLAISLEVAEHVSPESAGNFVGSLVGASDFVLFSAAIPFQGGTGHLNEQWPDYWARMFAAKGYVALDIVRKAIWNDKKIPVWYRQNTLLFVKEEKVQGMRDSGFGDSGDNFPLSVVHPGLYLSKMGQISSVRGIWRLLRQAAKHWIKNRFRKGG